MRQSDPVRISDLLKSHDWHLRGTTNDPIHQWELRAGYPPDEAWWILRLQTADGYRESGEPRVVSVVEQSRTELQDVARRLLLSFGLTMDACDFNAEVGWNQAAPLDE
jgi:hypothetical protein